MGFCGGFIIGVFVGALFGIFVIALTNANSKREYEQYLEEKEKENGFKEV